MNYSVAFVLNKIALDKKRPQSKECTCISRKTVAAPLRFLRRGRVFVYMYVFSNNLKEGKRPGSDIFLSFQPPLRRASVI